MYQNYGQPAQQGYGQPTQQGYGVPVSTPNPVPPAAQFNQPALVQPIPTSGDRGTFFPKANCQGCDWGSWGRVNAQGFYQGFIPLEAIKLHGQNGEYYALKGFGFNAHASSPEELVNSLEMGVLDTPTALASKWDENIINPFDVILVTLVARKGEPSPKDGKPLRYHLIEVFKASLSEELQCALIAKVRDAVGGYAAVLNKPKLYVGDRVGQPLTPIVGWIPPSKICNEDTGVGIRYDQPTAQPAPAQPTPNPMEQTMTQPAMSQPAPAMTQPAGQPPLPQAGDNAPLPPMPNMFGGGA